MLDGLEITQFTYFQQCGGMDLDLVPAEITYGLERIVAFLQGVESVYDIEWAPGVQIRGRAVCGRTAVLRLQLRDGRCRARCGGCSASTRRNAQRLLRKVSQSTRQEPRFPLLPAYDQVLKCSQSLQPTGCPRRNQRH